MDDDSQLLGYHGRDLDRFQGLGTFHSRLAALHTYGQRRLASPQTRAPAVTRYLGGGGKRQKQRKLFHKVGGLRSGGLVLSIMHCENISEIACQLAGGQYFRACPLHPHRVRPVVEEAGEYRTTATHSRRPHATTPGLHVDGK